MSRASLLIPFEKKMSFFINCLRAKKQSLLFFEMLLFSMLLFLQLFKAAINWKVDTKNRMEKPRFIDEETIPLV